MNGEVEVYRLNSPMKWAEFKAMPDDIKVSYIKLIREKFRVPDRGLAEMFGVSSALVSKETQRLGISAGRAVGRPRWDREGFLAWVYGVPVAAPEAEEHTEEVEERAEETVEIPAEEVKEEKVAMASCLPKRGSMDFEGNADEIVNTIRVLLCGAKVRLGIHWDLVEEDNG